jgi:hypothetical protein
MRSLILIAILGLSGCASTRVEHVTVRATPNRMNDRYDFSVEFFLE